MQATLDSTGLKHLARALTSLSKFGDDLVIVATSETFAISSTNTAMTAFGRFKYPKSFFSRYRVEGSPLDEDVEELPNVSGQIITKHLLSILKHKTNEKTCEKCEFVITDGPTQNISLDNDDEDRDSLESRLTVRLHCKHGIVKTHRLSLNPPTDHLTPSIPDPTLETVLTVGPKVMKNMLEHFPSSKGGKSDPQLVWNFQDEEVVLRSLETGSDGKGRPALITELMLSATEFEVYDLLAGPMTVSFHLREFNATLAYAEASQLSINLRFTDPLEPLYISVDSEFSDTLFVVATSQVVSRSQQNSQADPVPRPVHTNPRKRPREEDGNHHNQRNVHIAGGSRHQEREQQQKKQPMKVVHRTDKQAIAREIHPPPPPPAQPQPSWAVLTAAQRHQQQETEQDGHNQYEDYNYDYEPNAQAGPSRPSCASASGSGAGSRQKGKEKEPLFLPSSQISHLPARSQAAIIESGLGIEHMTAEQIAMMLDGDLDADELELGVGNGQQPQPQPQPSQAPPSQAPTLDYLDEEWLMENGADEKKDSFELVDDDFEMAPTQGGGGTRVFRPLFED